MHDNNTPSIGKIPFIIGLLICSCLFSSCNPFMVFRPDSEQIVKKGWARQPMNQREPDPIYCYQTLGYRDCYSAPLNNQDRLESYYGPKP